MNKRFLQIALAITTAQFGLWPLAASSNELSVIQSQAVTTQALPSSMANKKAIQFAKQQVFPSLVNIHVTTLDLSRGKESYSQSVGSGTIISKEGYVVTNAHVVNDGVKFKCTLENKREIDATLVGKDELTDLAVLKLDMSQAELSQLPIAKFGSSKEVSIGDQVLAMGSPLSLARSVTLGIVSNIDRVLLSDTRSIDIFDSEGLLTNWIQHDAAINPGSSGGPLVSLEGLIIGINARGGNQIGFAIPSDEAKQVVDILVKHGRYERSWIGLSFKTLSHTGLDEGVIISSVIKNSPADKAGLRAGDVIMSINGEGINAEFEEQIPQLLKTISNNPVGSSLKITYKNMSGKTKSISVKTDLLDLSQEDVVLLRRWNLSVEGITPWLLKYSDIEVAEGVVVLGTDSSSVFNIAEPQIQYDDIITHINGEKISKVEDIVKQYEAILADKKRPEFMVVRFNRDKEQKVTLVKTMPDDVFDLPLEIPKPWVGIESQPILEEMAKKLGSESYRGFLVTYIYKDTKAEQSSLKVGDIITKVNETNVIPDSKQQTELLMNEIEKLAVNDTVNFSVVRNKKPMQVRVQLEKDKTPASRAKTAINRDFGLTVRNLTFFDRDRNNWGDKIHGVIIKSISSGWAYSSDLANGELIQKINGHDIRSRKSFRKAMESIAKQKPKYVVFKVLNQTTQRVVYVEADWKLTSDSNTQTKSF